MAGDGPKSEERRERNRHLRTPCLKKKDKAEPPPSEEENGNRELRGFKVVHVFDISQTEGDELPEPHTVGGDAGPWIAKIEAIIAEAGIELEESGELGGADGMSTKGRIVVANDLSPANRFSVLVHELCHEETHSKANREGSSKKSRETEAEAVACIVSQAVGLDAKQSASDYIQLYAGDVETLTASLDVIQKEACSIIERLHGIKSVNSPTTVRNDSQVSANAYSSDKRKPPEATIAAFRTLSEPSVNALP